MTDNEWGDTHTWDTDPAQTTNQVVGQAAPERPRLAGRRPAARRVTHRVPARRPSPAPANFYPHVYAFVTGFVSHTYAHNISAQITNFRWCPQWWEHPEAVARLQSMWKAWEVLRLDPGTGASTWFRDHGDPAIAALTGPDGPFRGCSDTQHRLPAHLPTTEPPPGLFTP